MNCCWFPGARTVTTGVTAMEANAGGPTVRVVPPLTAPDVAVMVVVPVVTLLASPPALIVATPALAELHVTELVRICVLPSV